MGFTTTSQRAASNILVWRRFDTCHFLNRLQCDNTLTLCEYFSLDEKVVDDGEDGFCLTTGPRGERDLGRE
jgi:hypothetical protein